MPQGGAPILETIASMGYFSYLWALWLNKIRRMKLEISSSLRLFLFTKSCKVCFDFTLSADVASVLEATNSPIFSSIFLHGVLVAKNYKTVAPIEE